MDQTDTDPHKVSQTLDFYEKLVIGADLAAKDLNKEWIRVKKFILPGIMAVAGVAAVLVIALSLMSKTPVTLKMLRVDDVAYNVKGGDTVNLATGVESVYVDARPTDGAAIVKVTGDKGFKDGKNTLTITVTGSDGKSSATYTMTLIKPKLEGWCALNADKIKQIETDYADELIYGLPGYADLASKATEIKAHLSCFSDPLQKEITTNY